MGKRGPKPTREPTTHIRVPASVAGILRSIAVASNISIAVLIEKHRDKILDLLPMPPSEGPPLPKGMGVKWRGKKGKRS
jgi:hypothetical protein